MLPTALYLVAGDGVVPAAVTTAAMKASGVNADWLAANELVTAQRLTPLSHPNNSPTFCVACWTTIPPSPVAFEPDANNTNLSATSKLVVCWNEAVPCTIKLFVIVAFPVTVSVVPSNVKLLSPFIVPPPVAVNTLLSVLFNIDGNMFEAVWALTALLALWAQDAVIA